MSSCLQPRGIPEANGSDSRFIPIRRKGRIPFGAGRFHIPVGEQKEPSAHLVTFRMEHVSIKYGNRTILKDLDWEVRNGEKWALFGPNGAGKSTLLSLIYADNPQSYANTLYLFDRKRGSGKVSGI